MMRAFLILAPLLVLAACNDEPAAEPVAAATAEAENVVVAPTEAKLDTTLPGANGEYAYAELLELQPNDGSLIADTTTGAGLCRFADDGKRILLSVGAPRQEDKPGAGVVRPNGKPALALYAQSGGTDYMRGGPTLERKPTDGGIGMTVLVKLADDSKSATLTVKLAEGERDPILGTWTCEG